MNRITTAIAGAMAIVVSVSALAGPLAPPPGPLSSTGRFGPWIEITQENTPGDADSVYRITQAGSYYLGRNVTAQDLKHAIQIAAAGVTLDLNGFVVSGILLPPGRSLDGINLQTGATEVLITNGVILGWGDLGVNGLAVTGCTLRDVKISSCADGGAFLSNNARIERCTISSCLGLGLFCGVESRVDDCVVIENANGVFAGAGSVLTGCIVSENQGDGVQIADGAHMSRCVANGNPGYGVNAAPGSSLQRCVAGNNDGSGFELNGTRAVGCRAQGNGIHGFELQDSCVVATCVASGNAQNGVTFMGAGNLLDDSILTANVGAGAKTTGVVVNNLVVRNLARFNQSVIEYDIQGGNNLGRTITLSDGFVDANAWGNIAQ